MYEHEKALSFIMASYDKDSDTVAINIDGAQVNLSVAEWRKMVNEVDGSMVGVHAAAGEQVRPRVRVRHVTGPDNEGEGWFTFQVLDGVGTSDPFLGAWTAKRAASDALGVPISEIRWV